MSFRHKFYLIAKNVSTETVALSIALAVQRSSNLGNIAIPLAEKIDIILVHVSILQHTYI